MGPGSSWRAGRPSVLLLLCLAAVHAVPTPRGPGADGSLEVDAGAAELKKQTVLGVEPGCEGGGCGCGKNATEIAEKKAEGPAAAAAAAVPLSQSPSPSTSPAPCHGLLYNGDARLEGCECGCAAALSRDQLRAELKKRNVDGLGEDVLRGMDTVTLRMQLKLHSNGEFSADELGEGCEEPCDPYDIGEGAKDIKVVRRRKEDPMHVMHPNLDPHRHLNPALAEATRRGLLRAMGRNPKRQPILGTQPHVPSPPGALRTDHTPMACAGYLFYSCGDEWCPLSEHPCAQAGDTEGCCHHDHDSNKCVIASTSVGAPLIECALDEDGITDCDDYLGSDSMANNEIEDMPEPSPSTSVSPVPLSPTASTSFSPSTTPSASEIIYVPPLAPARFQSQAKPPPLDCDDSVANPDGGIAVNVEAAPPLPAIKGADRIEEIPSRANQAVVTSTLNYLSSLTLEQITNGFRKYDTNGDGRISTDELKVLISVMAPRLEPAEADLAAMIDVVDLDGDGAVSLDELLTAVQNVPKAKANEALVKGTLQYVASLTEEEIIAGFKEFDTNSDGKISLSELKAALSALFPRVKPTAADLAALIGAIDMDGDKAVSVDEVLALLRDAPRPKVNEGLVKGVLKWVGSLPEEEIRAGFGRFDFNQNGQISTQELKTMLKMLSPQLRPSEADLSAMIKLVDLDGDGAVSLDEILAAARQQVVAAVEGRSANRAIVQGMLTYVGELSDAEIRAGFKQFDLDSNGKITTEELKTVFSVLAGPDLHPSEADLSAMIGLVDLDGDGGVSLDELLTVVRKDVDAVLKGPGVNTNFVLQFLQQLASLSEMEIRAGFESVDTSGNGKITTDELKVLFKQAAPPVAYTDADLNAMITLVDLDGDNAVSLEEVLNTVKHAPVYSQMELSMAGLLHEGVLSKDSIETVMSDDLDLLAKHGDPGKLSTVPMKQGLSEKAEGKAPVGAESEVNDLLQDRPAVVVEGPAGPEEADDKVSMSVGSMRTLVNSDEPMPESADMGGCDDCPRGANGELCSGHGRCDQGQCECHGGYSGDACEGKACPGKLHQCTRNGDCDNGTCICYDGWAGLACDTPICPGTPFCNNNGACVRNHTCECNEGWDGHACDRLICPGGLGSECSNQGLCVFGVCHCDYMLTGEACGLQVCPGAPLECNGVGGCVNGHCLCQAGWKGEVCDQRRCPGYYECEGRGVCVNGTCSCRPGWKGPSCNVAVCPGSEGECNSRGICVEGRCECTEGWRGDACDARVCPGQIATAAGTEMCSGKGQCNSDGTCSCDDGWQGVICNDMKCPGDCSHHGLCRNGTCTCDATRKGPACSVKRCPTVGGSEECSGRGVCFNGRCTCEAGRKGPACELPSCPGYTPQHPDGECSGRGKCRSGECVCERERGGSDCSVQLCPTRGGSDCSGQGTCANGTCTCFEGFSSRDCSNMRCPHSNGNRPCGGRGQCLNGNCICESGWSAADCSQPVQCPVLPPCPGDPMCGGKMRGQCDFQAKVCQCMPGFTGPACETALQVCNGGSVMEPCPVDCNYICEDNCTVEVAPGAQYTCGCEDRRMIQSRGQCNPKCTCPAFTPVWDAVARKCVTGETCPVQSQCGMPLSASGMQVDIAVASVPCVDKAHHLCVCGGAPLQACWKVGSKFSRTRHGEDDFAGLVLHEHGSGAANTTDMVGLWTKRYDDVLDEEVDVAVMSGTSQIGATLSEGQYTVQFVHADSDGTETIQYMVEDSMEDEVVSQVAMLSFTVQECTPKVSAQCKSGGRYDDVECSGNGVCTAGVCVCDPGWTGADCSELQNCPGATGVKGILCSGHGSCQGCHCDCHPGWMGVDCSYPSCPEDCSGNGACIEGACQCSAGWAGADCARDTHSDQCPSGPNGLQCSNQGFCVAGVCECSLGWTGDACEEKSCPGYPDECSGRGSCVEGRCVCDAAWMGARCDYPACPTKSYDEGFDYGEADKELVQAVYKWVGSLTESQLMTGFRYFDVSGNGKISDQELKRMLSYLSPQLRPTEADLDAMVRMADLDGDNEVSFSEVYETIHRGDEPCSAHGTCVDGTCQCYGNYYGDDCAEKACVGTPMCSEPNGKCVDGVCQCEPGWDGVDCSYRGCARPTEARVELGMGAPCSNNGICLHTNGTCLCLWGYQGEACDVAECPEDCSMHGSCRNGQCVCDEGWKGMACMERACVFGDPQGRECSGHGLCDDGECVCDPRYAGQDCSVAQCPVSGAGVTCSDNGVCNNGVCECYGPFTGPDCGVSRCPYDCYGNGLCVEGACKCGPEHKGEYCQLNKPPATSEEACLEVPGMVWTVKRPDLSNASCVPSCENAVDYDQVDCFPLGIPGCACDPATPLWDYAVGGCVAESTCGSKVSSAHGVVENGRPVCKPGLTGDTCETPTCLGTGYNVSQCWGRGECESGQCSCDNGYAGAACERLDCGGCVNGECQKSGVCQCRKGWSGVACDVGECPSLGSGGAGEVCGGVLQGECDTTRGRCQCSDDFEGLVCQDRVCPKGPGGLECDGHGHCNVVTGECLCLGHYEGAACAVYAHACSDHGTVESNGLCSCFPGFSGDDCSDRACPAGVSGEPCSGSGTCDVSTGQCNCHVGHAGPDCGDVVCPRNCAGHGDCHQGVCACEPGWQGVDCAIRACINNCSHNGRCVFGICKCHSGFHGADCSLLECPGMPLSCTGHGECVAMVDTSGVALPSGASVCKCSPGYVGNDCSIPVPAYSIRVVEADPSAGILAHTRCEFPFEYKHKTYTSCTSDWSGQFGSKPWCSLTGVLTDKWAPCLPSTACLGAGGMECSGHGSCGTHPVPGMCTCEPGWVGYDCAHPEIRVTTSSAARLHLVSGRLSLPVPYTPDWAVRHTLACADGIAAAATVRNTSVATVVRPIMRSGGPSVEVEVVVQTIGAGEGERVKAVLEAASDQADGSLARALRAEGVDAVDTSWTVGLAVEDSNGRCWVETEASNFCPWDDAWTVRTGLSLEECYRVCEQGGYCSQRGLLDYLAGDGGQCVLDAPCTPVGFKLYQRRERCGETDATEFHGNQCQLPFKYMGKTYNTCTADYSASGREWCSTTVDFKQKWGFCAPKGTCPGRTPCSGHGKCGDYARCVCDRGWKGPDCGKRVHRVVLGNEDGSGAAKGTQCVLPFTVNGVVHDDCIRGNAVYRDTGLEWCITDAALSGGSAPPSLTQWGYCAPPGTCVGDPECGGKGQCVDSVCVCEPKYTGAQCEIAATESTALQSLYKGTGGAAMWLNEQGWAASAAGQVPTECARMYGLTCEAGKVLAVELANNGLDGTIPANLELLSMIQTLDLSDNQLMGTLPATLGQLTTLTVMSVSNNRLTGAIPDTFTALTALTVLDVSHNYFVSPSFDSFAAFLARLPRTFVACDNTCVPHDSCKHRPTMECPSAP